MKLKKASKAKTVVEYLEEYTNNIQKDEKTKEFIIKTKTHYENKLKDKNGEENLKVDLIQLENEKLKIEEFNPFDELSSSFSLIGIMISVSAMFIAVNNDESELKSVLNFLSILFCIIALIAACMVIIYQVMKSKIQENNINKSIALNIHISIIKEIVNN